jgi:hypothetical protein
MLAARRKSAPTFVSGELVDEDGTLPAEARASMVRFVARPAAGLLGSITRALKALGR